MIFNSKNKITNKTRMSVFNPNPTPNIFGQQTTSLFGQQQPQPTSLFNQTSSLFNNPPQGNTNSLFNQNTMTTTFPTTSPFNNQQNSLFNGNNGMSTTNTNIFTSNPPNSNSLFSSNPTPNLFSGNANSTNIFTNNNVENNGTFGYQFQGWDGFEERENKKNAPVKMYSITSNPQYSKYSLEEIRTIDLKLKKNGQNINTGTNLFGMNNAQTSTGLFNNTQSNNIFQPNNSQNQTSGGLFNQTNTVMNNAFSNNNKGLFNNPITTNSQSGGLFGNQNGGGLFSNQTNSLFSKPQTTTNIFNNSSGSQTGNLFSNQKTSTTQSNSLFGGVVANTLLNNKSSTGGLFNLNTGSNPNQQNNNGNISGNIFGNQTTSTGSLFGNPASSSTSTGGLFSNNTNTNGNSLFSKPTQQQQQSTSLFSNPPVIPTSGSLFSNSSNNNQQPSGGSLFNASTNSNNLFNSGPLSNNQQQSSNVFSSAPNNPPQQINSTPANITQPMISSPVQNYFYNSASPTYPMNTITQMSPVLNPIYDNTIMVTESVVDALRDQKKIQNFIEELESKYSEEKETPYSNYHHYFSKEQLLQSESLLERTFNTPFKYNSRSRYSYRKSTQSKGDNVIDRALNRYSSIQKTPNSQVRMTSAIFTRRKGSSLTESMNKEILERQRRLKENLLENEDIVSTSVNEYKSLTIHVVNTNDEKRRTKYEFDFTFEFKSVTKKCTVLNLKEAIEEKVYQQYPKSSLFKIVKNVIMLSTGPLEDSKLLEYYDSTLSAMMGKSPIDCYLTTAAIPEVTSPKREQDDIAPAELIPKLTKKGYMTSPDYVLLCRMTQDELRNVKDFKIYNEHGEVHFIDKVNLLGLNLDEEISIEERCVEIKETQKGKGLNVNREVKLNSMMVFNGKEDLKGKLGMIKEKITELGGEYENYDMEKNILSFKVIVN